MHTCFLYEIVKVLLIKFKLGPSSPPEVHVEIILTANGSLLLPLIRLIPQVKTG